MDLSSVLIKVMDQDPQQRAQAEQYLAASKAHNVGMYLNSLTAELVAENKNLHSRMAAALILKNELTSQDEIKREQRAYEWLTIDAAIRENIKNGILHTLGSPQIHTNAAQVCACIAQIELPKNLWPQLIEILQHNCTSSTHPYLKKGSLQALGFICEEINPQVVREKSNAILTTIVTSMRQEETNLEVKRAAAKALENALEFVQENFKKQDERDYIMSMVCSAVCSTDLEVKIAGYECLVKIASLYYEYLPSYIQHLFSITLASIKNDQDQVALQAIEFWSTICDEENYLMEEIEDAAEMNVQPNVVCHSFVKGAQSYLVPLILETLTKQDEHADEDQWDVAMAGATCLTLIANCVHNDILGIIDEFIGKNIRNENWHFREAASMAFGSILEGVENIPEGYLVDVLRVLVEQMKGDKHPKVKDTAAWAIGRVCQHYPSAIKGEVFNPIMEALLNALGETPRVAANVCWALNNIAEAFRDEETAPAPMYKPFFEQSVYGLLKAAERPDADEHNLKVSAYEAINELIESAKTPECRTVIQLLVPAFLTKLEQTFSQQVLTQEDKDAVAESQALLCSLLQTCTKQLGSEIRDLADRCVAQYLRVFNVKSASVHDEALLAFGALANALEADFEKYMPVLNQILLLGLRSHEEYQVCTNAVGVVGDVCRALQKKVANYCQHYVTILLENLQNPQLNKSVKPPILSCFGDIALATGGEFAQYLSMVMSILIQAANYQVDKTNDELVEYQNELRVGIFEAFTGILQGLRADKQADLFLQYAEGVVHFITEIVFKDKTRTEDVICASIGVLGDLAHCLGPKVKPLMVQESVKKIINETLSNSEPDSPIGKAALWTQEVLGALN